MEFRLPLNLILERLESDQFEIALFGRVSSGKSSLLNRVQGTEVLPVGVTPVTALPTRLLYGKTPAATVLSPRFSVALRRPWWLGWFRPFRRSYATRRARRLFAGELSAHLETYARQLGAWAEGRIARLENLYDSLAGSYSLLLRGPVAADQAGGLLADLGELEEKTDGQRHARVENGSIALADHPKQTKGEAA